ncbi:MAG TPA: N-acetylglucosamine-6-phosphate deacetylase [Vicinamibacterales bacterium]|nr:N-acetylglucosamine-6-phosphate deacetylase [Vicinamibacterales bacterium]
MIRIAGADLVLPDRVIGGGTVTIDGDRIVGVDAAAPAPAAAGDLQFTFSDHYLVPGFIDVHVHGVEGRDTLDGGDAIRAIAERLPRFGVTAFCPTTIACDPAALRRMLASVGEARAARTTGSRVLPAHLESNFISPEFKGAQPLECLRLPSASRSAFGWGAGDILDEIAAARADVGIVTIAPELDGALPLIADLAAHGHHVSLGHSGASYDQAMRGIREGARQATHLFNRMTPVGHREPGLAGAVLESDDVVAELICDGVHVHPAMMRVAIAAKRPERIMAITDATAGAGLARGARATIGGRPITVRDAAYLDDGTIAGSVLTMDRAFAMLTGVCGLSLSDAAVVCASTPARALGLRGFGVIAPGAAADLVVMDRQFRVVQTWIAGNLAYSEA